MCLGPKLPDNDAIVNFAINIIFRIVLGIPARQRIYIADFMGGGGVGRKVRMDRTPTARDIYAHSHKYVRAHTGWI
jgi:hypothetical protein